MKKRKKEDYFLPGVEQALVKQLMSGASLPGVMAPLIKRLLEAGLEGELDFHLKEGEEKGLKNRRNGAAQKSSHCLIETNIFSWSFYEYNIFKI